MAATHSARRSPASAGASPREGAITPQKMAQLRRNATRMHKKEPERALTAILDQLAQQEGYPHWNALSRAAQGASPRADTGAADGALTVDDRGNINLGHINGERFSAMMMMDVMVPDLVGNYDEPELVPAWQWIIANSSYSHRHNGTDGVHDYIVNVALIQYKMESGEETRETIPHELVPVIELAVDKRVAFIIFHQGT